MNPLNGPFLSRRQMLQATSSGLGLVALAGLCHELQAKGYENPLAPKTPPLPAKAKRVIFLSMRGGPSHVDTFDYKPDLTRDNGKSPATSGPGVKAGRKLLGSPWKFSPHGQSGLPISELFPKLAEHADNLCLLNGMYTDVPNHPQAFLMMHTGEFRFVRPSVGAWVLYGLGTANQNLPGFVSISPPQRFGGAQNYGSAFLPAIYQGTSIGYSGRPASEAGVNNLTSNHLPSAAKRRQLDLAQSFNQELLAKRQVDLELEGVIESLELGFRMQDALPELLNLSTEPAESLARYGIGTKARTDDFGRQCLMARRLVEAGVRYVECCHEGWDQHSGLRENLARNCEATDGPIAALLTDLKHRDMLQDTLVVWAGEFGRTPHAQNENGRDHNATGFSIWAAGGGLKGGLRFGATDPHGIEAVENRMHNRDLHATMLHLLGLDHERLTFNYSGREFRLTGIEGAGRVVKEIVA